MRWSLSHGEWLLRRDDGKLLGHVYRYAGYWCAETDGIGLTTGPGSLEWAQDTLWSYCLVDGRDRVPEKTYDHATTR